MNSGAPSLPFFRGTVTCRLCQSLIHWRMLHQPFILHQSQFSRAKAGLHPDFLLNSFGHVTWSLIEDTLRRQQTPSCCFFNFFISVFILTTYLTCVPAHYVAVVGVISNLHFCFTVPLTLYTHTYTHAHTPPPRYKSLLFFSFWFPLCSYTHILLPAQKSKNKSSKQQYHQVVYKMNLSNHVIILTLLPLLFIALTYCVIFHIVRL